MKTKLTFLVVTIFVLLGCRNSENGTDSSPSVGTQKKKLFVIQNDLSGDLKTAGSGTNGVAGADNLCQSDSQNAGGTYKALIVDGTNRVACTTANCGSGASEHVGWVLKSNTEYVRADDETIVVGTTNSKGLFDFPLQNEWATLGSDMWMGLNADWTTATNNCAGFTDSSLTGKVGSTSYKTSGAIFSSTYPCNYYGTSLLCIEQ